MLAIFLLLTSLFTPIQTQADETFRYRIKPIPTNDRTNLEISLQFNAANEVPVKLPVGCYSLPDIYRSVKTFEGEKGTIVTKGKDETERLVKPNSNGVINIKYTLSFDPERMLDIAFAPSTGADYFHIGTCQWMLQIGELDKERPFVFEMIDAPKDWELYSSLGANPAYVKTISSYNKLTSSAIGGGNKNGVHRFSVKEKPVAAFVHGGFKVSKEEIFQVVERIVTLQREWMNDYEQPFYTVAVRPRNGIIAGTAPANYMVAFIKPEATKEEFNILLAHEMFHHWLPGRIEIKPEKGYRSFIHSWFHEGFNEYFARRILLEADLLTPERFAELINGDIINIANNPFRNAAYEDLIDAAKKGRFDSAAQKIAYYRGVLIAVNWEAELQRKNKTGLKTIIRNLNEFAAKYNGEITGQQFFEFMKKQGIDAKKNFEEYSMQGLSIPVYPNALGKNFVLRKKSVPHFDPGFSVIDSFNEKKITGVVKDGAAYRAGLRNGMELVRIQNSNRFANAWREDRPMLVTIKENSSEKVFEFFPLGEPLDLLLFEPVKNRKK